MRPSGAMRGAAGRGGRVKTLRVLQGSVRTLHQLWIGAWILQELCRVYAFHLARRQGAADSIATRIPPSPFGGSEAWRLGGLRAEATMGFCCGCIGAVLGLHWACAGVAGVVLGPCWGCAGARAAGAAMGLCWSYTGTAEVMLGLCWAYTGNTRATGAVLGLHWGCAGG